LVTYNAESGATFVPEEGFAQMVDELLPPSYSQVTARFSVGVSGTDGVVDSDGFALDGDNDGIAGGNFQSSFSLTVHRAQPRLVPQASCSPDGSILTITVTNEGDAKADPTITRVTYTNRPNIPVVNLETPELEKTQSEVFTLNIPSEAWFENRAAYTINVDAEGSLGVTSETLEGYCSGRI
jgi:hypothetical protein